MSNPGNLESEIKLVVASVPDILARLAANGFAVSRPEVFEENDVFDTSDLSLRNARCLLRIRHTGSECIITLKGPPVEGPHKVREELEFLASDAEQVRLMFARLGYQQTFRYEKYRTEFRTPNSPGLVTLDRTPIGNFLEIEAEPGVIDRFAAALGFSKSDYITKSYGTLYREYRELNDISSANMLFAGGN